MKVAIIGAGIGGLALTCGLQRTGIEVDVFDRDLDLASTAGYHLHLDGRALGALRRLLDPAAIERLYASAASGRADLQVAMRDHRGRLLGIQHRDEDGDTLNVDRITLRAVLADAAGSAVRLGRTFTDFAVHDGVDARFADGTCVTADALIGADGVGSRVALGLAGRSTAVRVGVLGVGGFTPVSALPADVAALFGTTSCFAVGPWGTAMYVGFHDPVGDAVVTSSRTDAATRTPTLIWGVMLAGDRRDLGALVGSELRDATAAELRRCRWSDTMRAVVEHATDDGLAAFPLRAAPDPAGLAPWPAGRVTALGDAVHAVPPTGGQGAATAIRDADALCRELVAADAGRKTVAMAMYDFERQMRAHARPALVQSLVPIERIRATTGPIGANVTRVALPLLAAACSARRRLIPDKH